MGKSVGREDVAKEAGVSESTVSRALNDSPLISEEIKKKVRQAAEKLGYFPSRTATLFASNRSFAIGFVVPFYPSIMPFTRPYFPSLLDGLLLGSLEHNYTISIVFENHLGRYRSYQELINSHSFETFQILRNIKGFEEIAPWAAYHHEEPGGSGYPFHVDAATLPIEARILRVADIFQAMVQDRPYRAGLGAQEALAFLQKLATEGRIDRTVFATLSAFIDDAMRAARPGASRDVQSEGADHV